MREVLKEIMLQIKEGGGCVPNLRGASPVGRGEGGGSDAATAVDGGASQRGWSGRADGHDQGAEVAASNASRDVGGVDGRRPWGGRRPECDPRRRLEATVESSGSKEALSGDVGGAGRREIRAERGAEAIWASIRTASRGVTA